MGFCTIHSQGVPNSIKCNSSRTTFVLETAVSYVHWIVFYHLLSNKKCNCEKVTFSIHNCVPVNRSPPLIVPVIVATVISSPYQKYYRTGSHIHPATRNGHKKTNLNTIFGAPKDMNSVSFTLNRRRPCKERCNNFDGGQQIAIWNELYFYSLSILIWNNIRLFARPSPHTIVIIRTVVIHPV